MTLVLQHIAVQYFLIIWVVKYGFHLVVNTTIWCCPSRVEENRQVLQPANAVEVEWILCKIVLDYQRKTKG